jgi:glycosyltransferase involved in cell wall biosynthesis
MGKRLIYDIDDLIFLRHASRANRFVKFLKGKWNIHYLMTVSDHVIVCTEYLKAYALRFNSHVTNISSTIDTEVYRPRGGARHRTRLCIGWSGSHTTVEYVALLQRVFEELRRRYDFYIKIIGYPQPPLSGLEVVAQDWRLASEVEDLQEFDIGVYPLPNDEWVLGKSGLKALQYMGLGIPTVATAIGATLEIIRDGENGFLASSDDEWVQKLSRLLEDAELRRRMGANSRKTVEERYSVQVNMKRYLDILDGGKRVSLCPPG